MSPEISHSATRRTRDTQWWLTEHLVPGGLGRGTADLGRQQKDGQGLMDGQDFETKCHLQKPLSKTGREMLSHSSHLPCTYSIIKLLGAFWLVDFGVGVLRANASRTYGHKKFLI